MSEQDGPLIPEQTTEEQLRIAKLEIQGLKHLIEANGQKEISDGMIAAAQKDTVVALNIQGVSYKTTLHRFSVDATPRGTKVVHAREDGSIKVWFIPGNIEVSYTHRPLTEKIILSFKDQVDKEIAEERAKNA